MPASKQKHVLAQSILDCIERALTLKFGENICTVIFGNFEARVGINRSEIAFHPMEFEQVLNDIFGTGTASQLVKRSIFNELTHRFQIFDQDYFELSSDKERIVSKAIDKIVREVE